MNLLLYNPDEIYSGKYNGRVLNLELYTHRRQRLSLLHLFTDLFCKDIFLTLQNKYKVNNKFRINIRISINLNIRISINLALILKSEDIVRTKPICK